MRLGRGFHLGSAAQLFLSSMAVKPAQSPLQASSRGMQTCHVLHDADATMPAGVVQGVLLRLFRGMLTVNCWHVAGGV